MTPAAPCVATGRRLIWLALLVVALLGRGLAPEGWMTAANAAGGIDVTICDGHGPMPVMVMAPDGSLHKKVPAKSPMGDHPCAFAGMAVANTAPPPTPIELPPAPGTGAPLVREPNATPGRGLAAPPPPSTGPPALT
ncbi:MAG: DUF2946 family protein [Pseudomonadota bacterium]